MTRNRLIFIPVIALLALVGCGTSGGGSEGADPGDATTTGAVDETTTSEAVEETTTEPGADDPTTTEVDDDTTTTEDDDDTTTTEDDDDTTTTEAGGGGEGGEVCDALKTISEFDEGSGELITGGAEWPEVQAYFIDQSDDVLAAYDDAIEVAPDDLADDLTTLREFSEGIEGAATDSSSLAEFSEALTSLPGIIEAGSAGLSLNTYAEGTCGFATGGNT